MWTNISIASRNLAQFVRSIFVFNSKTLLTRSADMDTRTQRALTSSGWRPKTNTSGERYREKVHDKLGTSPVGGHQGMFAVLPV